MQASDEYLMWLEPGHPVARADLARMCGLSVLELEELIGYGCLALAEGDELGADVVPPLREAARVRELFDLDLFSAGLLLQYLRRIEALERQVRSLQALLPAGGREGPSEGREPPV